jgi:hypothetical protein
MESVKPLDELVRELSPDIACQVRDYAEFLVARRTRVRRGTMIQSWAGALREFRDPYTSLDLQKQTLEWRSGGRETPASVLRMSKKPDF